ncbi:hypothetical protein A0H81_13800 [Grifola frondosa]|uniref:Aminotransferase class I/classII large domain-containing protein n=1 Tax=Grifola frondosa TaxID=5627 RepID=A0A1C7LN54_GRIFR|nr:hypothetical protein A0H81_13800 [Grifola frondosa]
MACLLNIMGTAETVINKSKRRYDYMFPSVLLGMLGSTIPVSIIGIRFAMSVDPFWRPDQYIPVVGMLCGSTISGIVVSVTYVLKELYENKDKVEMYLAFGASRFEACKPVATEALRLALTPNINQMSVIGIIAIPGMMTGAILGGSSVEQAARLQMVIMFMISSSTALASIATTILALGVTVDSEHRVRTDRIDTREHAVWRARSWLVNKTVEKIKSAALESDRAIYDHWQATCLKTSRQLHGLIELEADKMVKSLPTEFYSSFLSDLAKERKPSPIRGLYPLESRPGLISLLAGKPNATTFPLTSLQLTSRSPKDSSKEITTEITGSALAEGLQYGPTAGLPKLCEWVYGLQEIEHGRKKGEGWRVSIGSGSQDVIYKAIMALVNPGDPVLVESPVYAGVLPMFQALHAEFVAVETDSQGISSTSLRTILESWPSTKPKPKVLYTVPYGCNPTGMTATLERHDPYYYLYFGNAPRVPSYFSLELQQPEVGRVLRFDSLSKILSSGIRIGFACGPEPLMQVIDMHTAIASLQTPSLTQTITFALLNEWGYDGFKAHTEAVSQFYREKRDVFEGAMKKHLAGLAEWNTPEAGMFFWFKLLLGPHGADPEAHDSESIIRTKALEKGVLALPGTVFLPNGGKTAYVRAAFSLLGEQEVDEAIRRLREVVLEARQA